MKLNHLAISVVALSTICCGSATAHASSLASSSGTGPEPGDTARVGGVQHCITDTVPQRPGSRILVVADRWCGTIEERDARLSARAQERLVGARSAGVPLVTVYQYAGWGGGSDTINGPETCDHAGYGFGNIASISWWDRYRYDGVSSYKVWGKCNESQKYSGTYFTGRASNWVFQDQWYVGDEYNDLGSLRVRRNA